MNEESSTTQTIFIMLLRIAWWIHIWVNHQYFYDSGVISTVLEMDAFQEKFDLVFDTEAAYGVVPVSLAASCIASFGSGFIADSLGRKNIFYIASILHEIGCVLEIAAGSQASFFAGRILTGFAVGVYSMIVPLYQSEIARPENRGTLITFYQIFVTLGFCVAFWLGYGTFRITTSASYMIPIGLQLLAGFLLLIGTYFIPESPRWLIYKNKNSEAFKILTQLRGKGENNDVLMEYTGIVQDVMFDKIAYTHPFRSLLKKGTDNNLKRTLLGMGVHTFTQFTGINAILFYLPHILESAGIPQGYSALLGNGAGGAVNFLATLFVLLFIDKWDRRFILICGAIAMCICMVVITIVSAVYDEQLSASDAYGSLDQVNSIISNHTASYAILVLLCVFIAFFALSWGPIGWIYPAEIYPQMIRANAMGVTTSCSYLFSLFVSLVSPIMFRNIAWGTYLFFGIMCLVMACVVHKYYPETRGRSLEEIQLIFSGALIDQRPDAHHPATAAEALIHLEQIQLKNKRQDEFQDTLDWGMSISSPHNVSRALNHRNPSTTSILSDKHYLHHREYSLSSLELTEQQSSRFSQRI